MVFKFFCPSSCQTVRNVILLVNLVLFATKTENSSYNVGSNEYINPLFEILSGIKIL